MSNGAQAYVIDTNSLMDWHDRYYPTDVFDSLIPRFDSLIAAGRLYAPELVKDEINAVGPTGLLAWAKARPGIFEPTAIHLADALKIEGQFPGMKDPKAQFDEADAYVIAMAQMRSAIVVTQETSASQKQRPKRTHFIPDVCQGLGLPCINILGLMRREGWKL